MQFEIENEKKKRHRRTAQEIARHFKCPIDDCPRSYGSEGAVNQHLKNKHPEYYEKMLAESRANETIMDMNAVAYINNKPSTNSQNL